MTGLSTCTDIVHLSVVCLAVEAPRSFEMVGHIAHRKTTHRRQLRCHALHEQKILDYNGHVRLTRDGCGCDDEPGHDHCCYSGRLGDSTSFTSNKTLDAELRKPESHFHSVAVDLEAELIPYES